MAAIIFGGLHTSLAKADSLSIEKAAKTFGAMPTFWGLKLSPDGQRISLLKRHASGIPIALVIDLEGVKPQIILASDKDKMDISWCDWANDSRILCGFYGIKPFWGDLFGATRLVAVNSDGTDMKVLAQRQQRDTFSFHQDEIVDWLPDDREHILMEIRGDVGEGVSRINIYNNRDKTVRRARVNVWDWRSDGRGNIRLRLEANRRAQKWRYLPNGGGSAWEILHEYDPSDHQAVFEPQGFGESSKKLLVFDRHEGRTSLFEIELNESLDRNLVYSHPDVDLSSVVRIGKHDRIIGYSYSTDKPHIDYIDKTIQRVHDRISSLKPGKIIWFISESWDRRYYLVETTSDLDRGTYYRFDTKTNSLDEITKAYPKLDQYNLTEMTPIKYESDDGVTIPSYVSIPAGSTDTPKPTIIFPHGGPRSRDEWGFDWLTQFLTARGYVVLQSNYRGSGGYGEAWTGDGGFREWERAMIDLEYGALHLVEAGIADPDRICVLGWSYGGYAALMSVIEFPDRYRCAVSIAGVTDPYLLISESRGLTRKFLKSLISSDVEDAQAASPKKRAKEIEVPVMLFHGDLDLNVPIKHSEQMNRALQANKAKVEFIEYEGVEHSIRNPEYRIDMLERIGHFLESNLEPRDPESR